MDVLHPKGEVCSYSVYSLVSDAEVQARFPEVAACFPIAIVE